MTKSEQIMALHAEGRSNREIACEVYGIFTDAPTSLLTVPMTYVRVVTRQRMGKGQSTHDRAWRAANPEKIRAHRRDWFSKRCAADPTFLARHRAADNQRKKARYASDRAFREAMIAKASAYYYARATNQP